jgi:MFS family permease
MRTLEQLLSTLALIAVLIGAFVAARRRARGSSGARRSSLLKNAVLLVIGLAIAFALPTLIPDTPGSPAALVMYAVCWLIGGSMAILALVGLVGSWLARPKN